MNTLPDTEYVVIIFDPLPHWAMICWREINEGRQVWWGQQIGQSLVDRTEAMTLARADMEHYLSGGYELLPNVSPLPSHPCGHCDAPIIVDDYLCPRCRV